MSITVSPLQIARMRLWHGSNTGDADACEVMIRSCQIGLLEALGLATDDGFEVVNLNVEHGHFGVGGVGKLPDGGAKGKPIEIPDVFSGHSVRTTGGLFPVGVATARVRRSGRPGGQLRDRAREIARAVARIDIDANQAGSNTNGYLPCGAEFFWGSGWPRLIDPRFDCGDLPTVRTQGERRRMYWHERLISNIDLGQDTAYWCAGVVLNDPEVHNGASVVEALSGVVCARYEFGARRILDELVALACHALGVGELPGEIAGIYRAIVRDDPWARHGNDLYLIGSPNDARASSAAALLRLNYCAVD